MTKEVCICNHSRKTHAEDKRCGATWISKETGYVNMCECMQFQQEVKS